MADLTETIEGTEVQQRNDSQEDSDSLIQGLTPAQIQVLAQKVYDLLLDELRIEAERHGRGRLR
jgi:hypothetical protein